MPTLTTRIEAGLEGNEAAPRIAEQAANLGTLADAVTRLASQPPSSVGALQESLRDLRLPRLQVGGELTGYLGSLQSVVPTDLAPVTGNVLQGLGTLESLVAVDLVRVIEDVRATVQAVHALTRVDLRCEEAPDAPAAGEGGAPDVPAPSGAAAGPGESAAAPAPAAAATARVDAALDMLPSPLTVRSLLTWLTQVTDLPQRSAILPRTLPVIDDLRDPLETLLAWEEMQPSELRAHLEASLRDAEGFVRGSLDAVLAPVLTELEGVHRRLQAEALAEVADGLTARLAELRAAVAAADLGATGPAVAAVEALLDRYESIRPALDAEVLDRIPGLAGRLAALPDDLEDAVSHVAAVLRPGGAPVLPDLWGVEELEGLEVVDAWLGEVVGWLQELADKLDFSVLQEPLATVADTVRGVVDGLDQAMAGLNLQVQRLFGEVDAVLDEVDMEGLARQVEEAIQRFQTELFARLTDLFAPVRDALHEVVDTLGQGVDAFEPAQVVDALRGALDTLVGVLRDPEVAGALEQVRAGLEEATQKLRDLSFAPVTDQVIAAIGEMADALRAVDPSQIPAPLQGALQAALAVIPTDLTPVTDPLVTELDSLVEGGPVQVLEELHGQPALLLDQVRRFEPAALVGDALSGPYRALLAEMEEFRPSGLLSPVEAELERLRERLRATADPGRAIQPLEPLFQGVLDAFDRLRPDDLVRPVEEAIQGTIRQILEVLPADDLFEQVDVVLAAAEGVVGTGGGVVLLLERVQEMLDGLMDPAGQLESWIESVLSRVRSLDDMTSVQARMDALAQAVDEARAGAVTTRLAGAADPLLDALAALDGQRRVTALAQAYRAIPRSALDGLPDSPEKQALVAALGRFDPTRPAFATPYLLLSGLREATLRERAALQTALAGWDARHFAPGGALDSVLGVQATPERLHQLLGEFLRAQLVRPVAALFAPLEPVRRAVAAFLARIRALVSGLQAKIGSILSGPDSLRGILEAMQQVVERLRGFDLEVVREGLNSLFAEVRGKLEALSPARLREALSSAFEGLLETLGLSLLIPPDVVAQVDSEYEEVLAKLRALDPETVAAVVQPVYETEVVPLLESFDVTPLLDALTERLRDLDGELRTELQRVNEAFQEMLRAVPSPGASLSAGVSL